MNKNYQIKIVNNCNLIKRFIILLHTLIALLFLFSTNPLQAQKDKLGTWGTLIKANMIPTGAANLPDGKIICWAAQTGGDFRPVEGKDGRTVTSIFDPATNSFSANIVISNTDHDMFCPGTANLPDGKIMVHGGRSSEKTSIYDPFKNEWSSGQDLNTPRGYHSSVTLTNGHVFTVGGSWSGGKFNKNAEVWNPTTGWVSLTNVTSDNTIRKGAPDPGGIFRDDNHAWLVAAPEGKIYQLGPGTDMHLIDTKGSGSVKKLGKRASDAYSMNGTAVMYDKGKILAFGGAESYSAGHDADSRTHIIDINGSAPVISRTGNLKNGRTLHNAVILPNGEVLAIGGKTKAASIFQNTYALLTAEIWNPKTGKWRLIDETSHPRQYHSSALLMKDGRVWAGGGGLCGPCPANYPDAEILTPPYLYNASGELAARPNVITAPKTANYNSSIKVKTNKAITNFSLYRLSSATHSTSIEQRRIPLAFKANGGNNYTLTVPNSDWLPPGYYWLFSMDKNGVPSIGHTIKIEANSSTVAVTQLLENGPYYVQSSSNGQRMTTLNFDLHNARFAGAKTSNEQVWTVKHFGNNVYSFKNKKTGRFLHVPASRCISNTNVTTWTSENPASSKWIVSKSGSNYFLRPSHCTSQGLDKDIGFNKSAQTVTHSPGNANQQFKIIPVVNEESIILNGTYYVQNTATGQRATSFIENTDVLMKDSKNKNSRRWIFKHIGAGLHTVKNVRNDRFLQASNVGGSRCDNGIKINTSINSNKNYQQWIIKKVAGNYYLQPSHCTTHALDKSNGTNGNVKLWKYDTSNKNQQWKLIKADAAGSRNASPVQELLATPMLGKQTALKWYHYMPEKEQQVQAYVFQHFDEEQEAFVDLSTVIPNENVEVATHSYTHTNPKQGENYYQVKIKYMDDTEDFSYYRVVVFQSEPMAITLAPNPATDFLRLDLSNYQDTKINYFISDMVGKVLTYGVFEKNHSDTETLDLQLLPNGNYFIYTQAENRRTLSQKLIIMRDY